MLNKMTSSQQPFSKMNFWLIGGCCVLIVIGFLLMLGGSSSIEEGFNPDIFSTRRIVVGPLLSFLGFLLLAFAILVEDPKKILHSFKKKGSNGGKTEENSQEESLEETQVIANQ